MYKIAIVDDDKSASEKVKKMIAEFGDSYGTELSADEFPDGQSLLDSEFVAYDIIFLDIGMEGKNGLEVAKELRARDYKSLLIFCTNLEQYAINGYEVDAMGYLIKPVGEYAFNKNMKKACELLKTDLDRKALIKTVHGNVVVPLKNIVYIEVQEHNLFFHVIIEGKDEVIRSRGSMQGVVKCLNSNCFAQCSACYLINMSRMLSLEKNMVNLGNIALPLSRNYKRDFTDKFMNFMLKDGAFKN